LATGRFQPADAWFNPVTIYLPLVPGNQPEAWDISLPKLYNVEAMVWWVFSKSFSLG
jgi:hypothetical protein